MIGLPFGGPSPLLAVAVILLMCHLLSGRLSVAARNNTPQHLRKKTMRQMGHSNMIMMMKTKSTKHGTLAADTRHLWFQRTQRKSGIFSNSKIRTMTMKRYNTTSGHKSLLRRNIPAPSRGGTRKDIPFGIWPRIPNTNPSPANRRPAPAVPLPPTVPPTFAPTQDPSVIVATPLSVCDDETEDRVWTLQATLEGASPAPSWWRALDVSIYGNTIVMGHLWDNGLAGSAYVYSLSGDNTWTRETILRGRNQWFGSSVSVYDDTIAVGAYAGEGRVYIYVRNDQGEWTEQADLAPSGVGNERYFDNRVALHKDVLAVSCEAKSGRGSAAIAYIFVRNGSEWIQQEAFDMDSNELLFYGEVHLVEDLVLFRVRSQSGGNQIGYYVYGRSPNG